MAYSGKYKIKNQHKYEGDPTKVIWRSMWERYCFKWCDNNTDVLKWSSEEVVIPYFYEMERKYHRYFPDLKIKFKNGEVALIEVKPHSQTKPPKFPGKKTKRYLNESFDFIKNNNKWKAAKEYCDDRNWKFLIWTENELEKMGIKPKSTRPLKPMTKRRGRKKKTKYDSSD